MVKGVDVNEVRDCCKSGCWKGATDLYCGRVGAFSNEVIDGGGQEGVKVEGVLGFWRGEGDWFDVDGENVIVPDIGTESDGLIVDEVGVFRFPE